MSANTKIVVLGSNSFSGASFLTHCLKKNVMSLQLADHLNRATFFCHKSGCPHPMTINLFNLI